MLGRFDYTQIGHAGYLRLIEIQNDVIAGKSPPVNWLGSRVGHPSWH